MERFCFVVVLAFLLSPVVGHSQTRILVSCRCETGGERLSGLVERSALLSLGQAGFVAVGADPASKDPSWTLEADVSYRSGNYRLELSFLSPEGSRLSSAVMSGRLSLDFDVNLMEAVKRVVRDSGVDFAPTRPTEAERGLASSRPALPAMREKQEVADLLAIMVDEAPPPSALMAPGAVLLPEPDEAAGAAPPLTPTGPVVAGAIMPEPAADEAPAMVSDNASPAVAASAGPAPPAVLSLPGENGPAAVVLSAGARPRGPLVIDADSGPVFVVGKASDTFRYGFDVSCRIGAAFDFGIFRLDAALRTGYARLSPTGLVGGVLHLVTLGPELGLVLPGSAPLRFRCRLSFGPLYVAAEASGSEVVGKILPFGSAGLGMDFLPAPRFSIGLELELMVVFERNEPLIALVPVLGLGLRF